MATAHGISSSHLPRVCSPPCYICGYTHICCIRQPILQTCISLSTCDGVQEALDADEHPDMMDFSDHADGLQRADSDVGHKHSGDPTTDLTADPTADPTFDPTADPAADCTTVSCSADLGQK